MVTKWGLSEKMGPLAYNEEQNEVFLGKSVSQQKSVSDETAHAIDSEIKRIIDIEYKRATKLIKDNLKKMHAMAEALMKYETIDAKQIDQIMAGKKPGAPENWSDDDTSGESGEGMPSKPKGDAAPSPASYKSHD